MANWCDSESRDGLTRVVSLKVGYSTFKRPITKICPYPKNNVGESIVANHITIHRQTKTYQNKRPCMLPIIMALFTLFTTAHSVPLLKGNSLMVTQFDTPPGLYFEKFSDAYVSGASWNVLAYFKLDVLIEEYMSIERSFNVLNNTCNAKFSGEGGCKMIVAHFSKRIRELSRTNSLIFGSRKRRAIFNIVGNVASDLFGVLDSRFGERYATDMSQLANNDKHLMQLLKNHTSIVESTLNIAKLNGEELEKQAKHFNEMTKRMQNMSDMIAAQQNYDNAATFLSHLMSDYERKQDEVIEVTTASRRNSISHKLITADQVENQIELIRKQVGNRFSPPGELDVYLTGKISCYKKSNQYIFKITIPLFKQQKYQVYAVSVIPIKRGDRFIWIANTHDYLITSTDRQYYQYFTKSDLSECVTLSNARGILCDKPNHWYMASKEDCNWNLFNHLPSVACEFRESNAFAFWKELNTANEFVFVMDKPMRVTTVCGDSVFHRTIEGEGILGIDGDCTIKHIVMAEDQVK